MAVRSAPLTQTLTLVLSLNPTREHLPLIGACAGEPTPAICSSRPGGNKPTIFLSGDLRSACGMSIAVRAHFACPLHSTIHRTQSPPAALAFRHRPTALLYRSKSAQRHFHSMTRPAPRGLQLAAAAATQDWTVVGGGRVGQALADMGENDALIRRGQLVEGPDGPIVVCTRNNDLEEVVNATPEQRRKDLVFIQNGMLQPWLAERGLQDNTQVLVYFAVAKQGNKPEDGKTDTNPEGLTAAWGLHAEAVASRLHANDLACKVLDKDAFQCSMLEKLIWISAFMLIGSKHKITVGEVESQHTQEIAGLMKELGGAGAAELGIKLDDGFVDRLLAYARSVASFPTAVKEFYWRNGWFYRISEREMAAGKPDPFPSHTALLKEVGAI